MTTTTKTSGAFVDVTIVDVPNITTFKVGNKGKLAAQKLREASDLEKRAKKLKAEAKELLEPILPKVYGNKGTFAGIPIVQVRKGTNVHTDVDLLKSEYPEAFAAAVSYNPYTYYGI